MYKFKTLGFKLNILDYKTLVNIPGIRKQETVWFYLHESKNVGCVAAGEPQTVLAAGPQLFQPPDDVVSLGISAAAPAQQQQQLWGRRTVSATARRPQQLLGGAPQEQQQWQW